MPTLPTLTYAALLYEDGNPPATPPSEDFIEGTKATNSDNLIFSFQRPEKTDGIKFTLEVFAFAKADAVADDGTTTFSRGSALFSGGKDGLAIEGDEIKVTDPIALSSSKSGTVNLKITVPADCLLEIDDTAKAKFKCERESETPNTYSITASGIPADSYPVTFTVKKDTEPVHIFTEYINVINGLCTDTWSGLAKDEAKVISQSAISSTLYVRGTGGWYETSTYTASDENSGSFSSPFATIQKAIDKVIAINDGTSEYTICIDGTLDGTTAAYLSSYGMADFSALKTNLNLTIKALSGTATLDGGARFDADGNVETGKEGIKKRIISATPTNGVLNLTLENLVITGGYNIAGMGGGIAFQSPGGELKISGSTKISGNRANRGGGVYIYNSRAFTMTGREINGNYAGDLGGGVYVSDAMLTITGGTISDCTSTNQGGGVYVSSTGMFEMSETAKITDCKTTSTSSNTGGGGIYCEGTLAITGGTISDCTSATDGGGIYNNVTNASIISTIENCTITGCRASGTTYTSGGGGIYNNSGKLELTNVNITGGNDTANPDANRGGGIFNGGTLKMTGGLISDCIATTGGGVCINRGMFTMSSGTISGNKANTCGGVYVAGGGRFRMEGGTISGNNSYGVYMNGGYFYMSGAAKVESNNVVYGNSSNPIYIAGALTATPPVATFYLSTYEADRTVLRADTGVTINEEICSKIALTDEGCKIVPSADGKTGVLKVHTIFLNSESGSDSKYGVNASTQAVKTLSKAIELYDTYNAEKIMVCAPYTLPSGESTLLNRTDKTHLTLMRYAGSSDGSGALTGNLLTVSQGSVGIFNTTLDGNKENVSAEGSLLYISGATTTVSLATDATLCNNKTSQSGGAVYINEGTFEMTSGAITGNETMVYGGGVFVRRTSTFEMCGGTISGNKAGVASGGGVYIGVTGSAVGTFTMSAAAKVESDNDVYLYNIGSNFATITVAGALTAESPVATIMLPASYNEARQVLSADGTNVTAITQDICDKFALSGVNWKIAPNADGTAGVVQLKSN